MVGAACAPDDATSNGRRGTRRGSTPAVISEHSKSQLLDADMRNTRRLEENKVKLLLLGAGESGKSTIFKQMKLLYGAPFTEDEANYIADVIYENVVSTMVMLVEGVDAFGFEVMFRCPRGRVWNIGSVSSDDKPPTRVPGDCAGRTQKVSSNRARHAD
jgi:hypothetical protein